jgi:uncharacterized membrane protein YbhN (UPF0104 family)
MQSPAKESPKPRLTWKTAVFPLIGLVAFFLYIYLFRVDIPAIIATAQKADPIPYALAIVLSLAEVFFYAVSWRVLLNFLNIKLSVVKSYLFVWYGVFLDIIIPAESCGECASTSFNVNKESASDQPLLQVTHRLQHGNERSRFFVGMSLFH